MYRRVSEFVSVEEWTRAPAGSSVCHDAWIGNL